MKQTPFIFQLNKKSPMRFAWICLIYIYVLQYPLSQLLPDATPIPEYDWRDWLFAYSFILFSSAIFMSSMYFGLSGRPLKIVPISLSSKRLNLPMVIIVFALFGLWSYLMLNLNIGMTIYIDFDTLPFRLTGILVYGRLFMQPMILAYIANVYANSKFKWFVFSLLIALNWWASLTSGSHFVSIMFSTPILLMFKGKNLYFAFVFSILTSFIIASLTRNFYLPYILGGEFIQIYANDEYQASMTENIYLLPLAYIINRPMGIVEFLMTHNFGDITSNSTEALKLSLAYFLPFISPGVGASIKNIYGLSDDAYGGFGLDFYSNYWVYFGGNTVFYFLGILLIGWFLGKIHRQFVIGLTRLNMQDLNFIVFILLFIITFEGRAFFFPGLFLLSWLFSRKSMPHVLFYILSISLIKRALRPTRL